MTHNSVAHLLYVVRARGKDMHDYLTKHPSTGELVSRVAVASPWRLAPVLLSKAQAQAALEAVRSPIGVPWQIEAAPNSCPSCERKIGADSVDFCYQQGNASGRWRAGCNEHDGGCGFEVEGKSFDDVMRQWNRVAHETAELA
jgi:hypothetical protein